MWDVIRAAMVSADTDTLSDVLSESFTLTHMTGFVQSRADWLAGRGQWPLQLTVDVRRQVATRMIATTW